MLLYFGQSQATSVLQPSMLSEQQTGKTSCAHLHRFRNPISDCYDNSVKRRSQPILHITDQSNEDENQMTV